LRGRAFQTENTEQTQQGSETQTAFNGRTIGVELAPWQITVNNIGPGAIYTPIDKEVESDKKLDDRILAEIPMGRWRKPEEVAQLVVYLASDDAAYVTGSTHFIDGGMIRNAGSYKPDPERKASLSIFPRNNHRGPEVKESASSVPKELGNSCTHLRRYKPVVTRRVTKSRIGTSYRRKYRRKFNLEANSALCVLTVDNAPLFQPDCLSFHFAR
jgi:hypothetical protein